MLRINELSKKGLKCLSFRTIYDVNEDELNMEDYSDLKQDIRMELADNYHSIYGNHWMFLKDKNNNILLGWVKNKVMSIDEYNDYIKPKYERKILAEKNLKEIDSDNLEEKYSKAMNTVGNQTGEEIHSILKNLQERHDEEIVVVLTPNYINLGNLKTLQSVKLNFIAYK